MSNRFDYECPNCGPLQKDEQEEHLFSTDKKGHVIHKIKEGRCNRCGAKVKKKEEKYNP